MSASDETSTGDPRKSLRITGRHRRVGLLDGRYELSEILSQGGMARVFRARHRDLGREFAVKLVKEALRDDARLKAQFLTEARLASSLAHPSIIQVTDYGNDERMGCFLVMELLEGNTLRDRLSHARLPLRVSLDVMDQIAGAVRYIHSRGIVHCDLKPENVFLSQVSGEPRRANVVKLLDFGLSWRAESLPDPTLGGTPPYLAPERLTGEPPSPLCDVYSLGVLLYELATGSWPYGGALDEIIRAQLAGAPPTPPSRLAPGVGERVDALVMRAIARTPEERPPSAEAFHFELRALMRNLGMTVRRHTLVTDSVLSGAGGDVALQAVADSPIPLAIFEPSGQVRFANRAFIDSMEGEGAERLPCFEEMREARTDPGIGEALARALSSVRPVRRTVLAGRRTLLLVPATDGPRLDSVHATLIETGME